MVRAAAAGVVDYKGADPRSRSWRIKHRLLLEELSRQQDKEFIELAHRHWLALLAHGNLTEESFEKVKTTANETLTDAQQLIFPWLMKETETDDKPATIDGETQRLIERYREVTNAKE